MLSVVYWFTISQKLRLNASTNIERISIRETVRVKRHEGWSVNRKNRDDEVWLDICRAFASANPVAGSAPVVVVLGGSVDGVEFIVLKVLVGLVNVDDFWLLVNDDGVDEDVWLFEVDHEGCRHDC
jgi:hypothetical protein